MLSTRHQTVHFHSSPGSSPDAFTTPSPRRSPPRLLNAAARGGLEPAPTSRLRRAYLHLPHSMKERFHFYISSPSFLRDTPLVHESGGDDSSANSVIVVRPQSRKNLAFQDRSFDSGYCKPSPLRLSAIGDDEPVAGFRLSSYTERRCSPRGLAGDIQIPSSTGDALSV
jgi:hypothetical protein